MLAADIYALAPHTGQGGWSWYSGSAGWMYRLLLESLLGLRLENGKLHFAPCLPPDWPGFELSYRYRATLYRIDIVQMAEGAMVGASRLWLDGIEQTEPAISLVDDIREHQVRLSFQPALPLVQGYL